MPKKHKTEKTTELPQIPDTELKMPEEFDDVPAEDQSSSVVVPVILIGLIFILIGILVGLYFWGQTLKEQAPEEVPTATRPTAEENNEPESTNAEADVQTFQAMSTSDEIDAIENDIESTNLDSLSAELNDIEAELNQ